MASTKEMGYGDYSAEYKNGEITLKATGDAPSAGYKVWFEQSMIAVFPPEFSLMWEAPGGLAADMMTPFVAQVSFPADEEVTHVIVHDDEGTHTVAVT